LVAGDLGFGDLVLQSRHQLDTEQGRSRKFALHGIPQLGARRLRIALRTQLLMHAFAPQIMHERPRLFAESSAHYREILPHRGMGEKLSHQLIAVRAGLGKQQNP
jgi:hypothetical protein